MTNAGKKMGPKTELADRLHAMKYRTEGEDFREAMNRVAFGLADNGNHYHVVRDILLDQRFCPGGRIQSAIGATRQVTAYNCFSGDTEILTERGFVRLDELTGRKVFIISPVSGERELATGHKLGRQRLNQITLSHSRFGQKRAGTFCVNATADHRWVRQDGSITTELKVGDLLQAGDSGIEGSSKGFLHGFIYGDGTEQRPGKFGLRLCGKKVMHLNTILDGAPDSRVTYPQSLEGEPFITLESPIDLKSLPSLELGLEYIAGFIHGILAADGCFSSRGNDAFQFHGSREVVEFVRDYLVLAGYAPCGRAHEYATEPTNYGPRSYPMWKQIFRPSSDHRGFRVMAIEPQEIADVYCVSEPKHQQLILRNGLRSGNCFVSGTIEDSFVEGAGSIMERAKEAAATMRMGGGIGYDFSTLRPKNDPIRKIDGRSSGPVGFMPIFNEICLATSSAGFRRGAQMGVLRVDHPDVELFIGAKQNADKLQGFNISLAITDEFMVAALSGKPFDLRFGGEIYKTIDAAALWEKIMRSTWDWGEPGVLFIDEINRKNNLYWFENLAASNPCAEQPLPPFGACLLGSFNLPKYLSRQSGLTDAINRYSFDYERLVADVAPVVRAMDNVVDRSRYPLLQQREEALSKRRMGLGVMGLANAGEALGYPFGSPEFIEFEEEVLGAINHAAYIASTELAAEKGPFPLFEAEPYCQGEFIRSLDVGVQALIRKCGIRNSHLTSIAPTGTISLCADNVSSGIEPVFAYEAEREVETPDGKIRLRAKDYGVEFLGVAGKVASEVTAKEHIDVLVAAQPHVDSAISKTCNATGMEWSDFKDLYKRAWEGRAKGCTTFRVDGKRVAMMTPVAQKLEDDGVCRIDPITGARDCA